MKNVKNAVIDSDTKLFALLGIVLTIVGFILALLVKKDNKYVMFYAKQGLVLFIAAVVANVVGVVMSFIPIIGNLVYGVLWVLVVILWVLGIIYSLSGEEKDLPIIGGLARKINV